MKICLGIPTYNRKDLLERLMKSLEPNLELIEKIFVIDNGNQGIPAYPKTTLVVNQTNRGYGGGSNQAISLSRAIDADWVLIVNDDITFYPWQIEKLIPILKLCKEKWLLAPPWQWDIVAFSRLGIKELEFKPNQWFDEIFWPGYCSDNDIHWRIKCTDRESEIFANEVPELSPWIKDKSKTKELDPSLNHIQATQKYIEKWGGYPGEEKWKKPIPMKNEIVVTHCGKMGDFMTALPIISWISKNLGDVHLVLPSYFDLFTKIESLMIKQPMIKKFSLMDVGRLDFTCGGQPYKHNPNSYGIPCTKWINLGFRQHPGIRHRTEFAAEEYGLGIDWDFTLDLGEVEPTDEILCSEEHIHQRVPGSQLIDFNKDVLFNARRMKAAKERHCWQSGMAHLLEWADVKPIHIHRVRGHDPLDLYSKDRTLASFIEIRED